MEGKGPSYEDIRNRLSEFDPQQRQDSGDVVGPQIHPEGENTTEAEIADVIGPRLSERKPQFGEVDDRHLPCKQQETWKDEESGAEAANYLSEVYTAMFEEGGFEVMLETTDVDQQSEIQRAVEAGELGLEQTIEKLEKLEMLDTREATEFGLKIINYWKNLIDRLSKEERIEEAYRKDEMIAFKAVSGFTEDLSLRRALEDESWLKQKWNEVYDWREEVYPLGAALADGNYSRQEMKMAAERKIQEMDLMDKDTETAVSAIVPNNILCARNHTPYEDMF